MQYSLGGTEPEEGKEDETANQANAEEDPGQLHMDIRLLPDLKCEDLVRLTSQYSELQSVRDSTDQTEYSYTLNTITLRRKERNSKAELTSVTQ